jgi:ketosteroid isomerase-like protein
VLGPSELADLAELNQLAYRYAAAVDACDAQAFVGLFWPDARLTVFGPGADEPFAVVTGHDQLAGVPRNMRERYTRTAHLMTNHVVDLDGTSARGTLLCTARHLYANAAGGSDVVVVIRYVDLYERREDRWRILDREIRFLWSETHAVLTDDQTVEVFHDR